MFLKEKMTEMSIPRGFWENRKWRKSSGYTKGSSMNLNKQQADWRNGRTHYKTSHCRKNVGLEFH